MLDGIDRCAIVKEHYIVIQGSVCVEYVDPVANERKFFFATPNKYDTYTFCDAKCFGDWLAVREQMWHDRILTTTPYGIIK
jgi:hypothetical protein